jgi:hypothetical protein
VSNKILSDFSIENVGLDPSENLLSWIGCVPEAIHHETEEKNNHWLSFWLRNLLGV